MSAALFYHPEAYTISGPKLMGRNAAGESFLRGFIRYSNADQFWIYAQAVEHAKHFAATAQSKGDNRPVRFINKSNLPSLAEPGTVFLPGPGLGEHAFKRSFFGSDQWSLCGITHTTSSAGAMDAIADVITSPVQPWDALICTSHAVKDNVTRLLQAQVNYLQERLGITKIVLPQLPVIPLGIHTEDFIFTPAQKSASRQALSISEDTIVVLFMGRLSFHAKAHPLAMYQALEKAAQATKKEIVLIECGWHANEFIKKAYEDAGKLACPNVRVITLDGRKPEEREKAWSSSDMLCSLSDNIQETFGIVPIEAMAAGLPVIVSDWDGYKDTVRDGIDGFRIPTLMPQAGLGGDLAMRHALELDTYDMYCGHTCSLIAVDIEAAAAAFEKLFTSEELRHSMGQAGQERAKSVYDWKVIIAAYEALWAELATIRATHKLKSESKSITHKWPARMDPFQGFAQYPTQFLTPDTFMEMVERDAQKTLERFKSYKELKMVNFANDILPSDEEVVNLLNAFKGHKRRTGDIIATTPQHRQAVALRSLAWLAKLGLLRTSK